EAHDDELVDRELGRLLEDPRVHGLGESVGQLLRLSPDIDGDVDRDLPRGGPDRERVHELALLRGRPSRIEALVDALEQLLPVTIGEPHRVHHFSFRESRSNFTGTNRIPETTRTRIV